MKIEDLVGKSYKFEDGQSIEVIQVKGRETNGTYNQYVTYQTSNGRNLPRRLIMSEKQFVSEYGHLFGYTNEYNQE